MTASNGQAATGNTRERMIDMALDLIADRGYEGLSLQMVADATGVTKAAVYYHFRTKADLLGAILTRLFANSPVPPSARELRSRRARLQRAADQIVDALTRHRRVISVISADPVIRKHPLFVQHVDEIRERALHSLYGDHPTSQEIASFLLASCAVHTLPNLTTLTDEELVDALRPPIYRTLGLPAPATSTVLAHQSTADAGP